MCGICGKLNFDWGEPVSREFIHDMAAILAHRGPNDDGFFIEGPIGLGHRRLSIIDVAGGRQPIANEDGTVQIIFNGEIYNHGEVRPDLEARGHRYTTRSDTETILHAYEQYGPDCVKRLRGMFAFAIWDARDRSLFLARDRFGIKPLYYRTDAHGLSFASEMKALLIEPGFEPTLDPVAMYDYFTIYMFGPRTPYREIRQLPPAHWMHVKDGKVRIERYWQPEPRDLGKGSEAEHLEELEHLLSTVIGDFLMSEVPQGVFLSGGVDSSLITILMSKLVKEPIRTFSISFEGYGDLDESRYARQAAAACNTVHHAFPCTPETVKCLPDVLWHIEFPLADAAAIALHTLCHEANKEVTVVHCGDGGDEAFGGYTRFYWDQFAEHYSRVPSFLRHGILGPAFRLGQRFPGGIREICRRGEKFTRFSDLSPALRYMGWFALTPDDEKHRMLEPDFVAEVGRHRTGEAFQALFAQAASLGLDSLAAKQYFELHSYIPDDLMLKADKIAMSAGLEGRFPFLDERLVEFGLSLPPHEKVSRRQLKLPLRKLLARHMPPDFVWRRKRGFGVPIESWFRTGLDAALRDAIHSPQLKNDGILNPAYVRQMVERLHAGDPHVWPRLWNVFVFQQWRTLFEHPKQLCLDRVAAAKSPPPR